MSCCLPADVETRPQPATDIERSRYNGAWHEALHIEIDITTRPVPTTPLHRHEPVGSKWVVPFNRYKDDPMLYAKAGVVAKVFGQKRGVDYIQTFRTIFFVSIS